MNNRIIEWSRALREKRWNIGFTQEPVEALLEKQPDIKWMKHSYKDRWFADPFILDTDDNYIYVLVEEFCYKLSRGRIARLVVNKKNFLCEDMNILLDLPTHLSFPYIIRADDKIYVMPENWGAGALSIYEYDNKSLKLVNPRVVINRPLTDSIIIDTDSDKYLLSTEIPNPNGNSLKIFKLDNNYNVVNEKEAVFDSNVARCAGDVFYVNGIMYRPSQDCNQCYGGAVVVQKVEVKDDELFFTDINRIVPQGRKWNIGLHTINTYGGFTVFDGHGYRYNFIAGAIEKIAELRRGF